MARPRILCFFLIGAAASAQPAQRWAQGDPTADEQAAMQWLNAARRDPVGTLGGLLSQAGSDPVIAAYLAAQIPATTTQLEQALAGAVAVAQTNSLAYPNSSAIRSSPLVFYPLFQAQASAAAALSSPPAFSPPPQRAPPDYFYPPPAQTTVAISPDAGTTGPDATGGTARFGGGGFAFADVTQANLYAPPLGGREYVLSLLTAPGTGSPPPSFLRQGDPLPNLTLGHIRMTGICLTGPAGGARSLTFYQGNSEFFSQSDLPFGEARTVFITGVAYQDNNGNGVYDPGEGVAGATIMPDHGDWYAVTASAGGYAIPVPANSGIYSLSASGGPFSGATATVTVGNDNVEVDWVAPAAATMRPAQVPVALPDGNCRISGLSARGLASSGAATLFGGFVVAGPAGSHKRLLIRAVGPSLQTTGLPADECVPATQLQIFQGAAVIAANAGWATAADGGAAAVQAAIQVGDFPLVNWTGGGGDSALVLTVSPGAYSAVAAPAPGAPPSDLTGRIGLVEIYDLSPGDGSRLVNLSARGSVQAGDAQLIVGCTVIGSGHERLLVRGVGPTLGSEFGVPGALPDPTLSFFDSAGTPIASNGNWGFSAQADQIGALAAAIGAFPLAAGSADSALLALVPPGNNSALVGARPGTAQSGIALVELYEAP